MRTDAPNPPEFPPLLVSVSPGLPRLPFATLPPAPLLYSPVYP